MPTHIIDFELPYCSKLPEHLSSDLDSRRYTQRRFLVERFLKEMPGHGRDELASRYQYNVESYGEYGIYLKRPTQLNKGFDFTVNICGMCFKKNRRYSNPSHQDIINASFSCKNVYPNEYALVKTAIIDIYNCMEAKLCAISATFMDFEEVNRPIQIILLAIRWLFMEQDCAYWNYSGREMFYNALHEHNLV
jgi:hypothetical protein